MIQGTFYNVSDFCAPILQKLDYENIWAEPFLLVTYIVDTLAILLILVGLILLACQNKLKGNLNLSVQKFKSWDFLSLNMSI